MPKKKERENLKPPFGAGSEDQCLEGFDGDDRSLNKQRSIGEQSSGGGSRKSRDKKQNSRSSKQESKIGSSTIERMGGHAAARRQAVTELLYHCSVGSLSEAQRLAKKWGISLSDPNTADYDKRTPLHLAAAEGCFSVAKWLLDSGSAHSPLDRFKRTPLEEAVRGSHRELISMLLEQGALVTGLDGTLGDLQKSAFAGGVAMTEGSDPSWSIEPGTIMKPGPVQLVKKISEGGTGSSFKGMWRNTVVAVKVLNESDNIPFGDLTTELDLMYKVHHPHVVQLFGAVVKQKPYMVVMEYMTGGSLYDVLKEGGNFTFWRSLMLMLDFARGMDHLHNRSQAIVHGDLRPSSLLLGGPKAFNNFHKFLLIDEVGVLKVAEYGLAKALKKRSKKHAAGDMAAVMSRKKSGGGGNSKTKGDFDTLESTSDDEEISHSLALHGGGGQFHSVEENGPYRYMAPEVFRGEPFTGKADVFSFAMICYHLFEGLPPFGNVEPFEAARVAAMEERRPFWGAHNSFGQVVPMKMRALVESCWVADPEQRPDFEEIVDMLESLVKKIQPLVTDDPKYVGVGKGKRRNSFDLGARGCGRSCTIS